jgi:hypothetical protein
MSDATIRASLKTLVASVIGSTGVVHDYSRWTDDEKTFEDHYQAAANQPLHGWEITREGFQTARLAGDKYKVSHDYLIRGFRALKDSIASEKLFNVVVDAVNQKIIDTKLPNTDGKSLPKVKIDPWEIGETLCHRAEIRLTVTEITVKTPEADQDLLAISLGQYLAPGTDWAIWTPATNYLLNAKIVPPVANGRKYKCTVAGISAAAEPVWPVAAGGTVVDGTATWAEDGAVVKMNSTIAIT